MKGFLLSLVVLFLYVTASAQCTDELQKLLPDYVGQKSMINSVVASAGNYLAVGVPHSDTLGKPSSGGVYLFERSGTSWHLLGLLKCSDPVAGAWFGSHISMDSTGETIAISSLGLYLKVAAEIYIFRKPASGWTDATETEKFTVPPGNIGIDGLEMSKDALTLAVGVAAASGPKLLVYDRVNLADNFAFKTPTYLSVPPNLFSVGVSIRFTSKYIGASFQVSDTGLGPPGVIVYNRNQSLQYPQLAVFKATNYQPYQATFDMTDNLIALGGYTLNITNDGYDNVITTFAKQRLQDWNSAMPETVVKLNAPNEVSISGYDTPLVNINDSTIAISYRYSPYPLKAPVAVLATTRIISRTGSSWNTFAKKEIIHEPLPLQDHYWYSFTTMTWNGSQLVVAPSLNNSGSNFLSSMTSITRDASGAWGNQLKFTVPGLNSSQFYFGTSVIRTGSSLLVGSPNDNEVTAGAGAVTIYSLNAQKQWVKKSKILPDFLADGMGFGKSMACSDSILAVTGPGYGETLGINYILTPRITLYKRTGPDWGSYVRYQDIVAPSNIEYFGGKISVSGSLMTISAWDDNLKNKVLLIYKRTTNGYSLLQDFKFDKYYFGTSLGFQTQIRSDTVFVFNGYQGGGPIVFGAILTKDASGQYSVSSTLTFPSVEFQTTGQFDLENMNIEVAKDQIFLGLPAAIVDGKRNVGVVVVYSKGGDQVWPAGELIPNSVINSPDKNANGYFGASLTNSGNSLMVGAPGTNFNNGTDIILPPPGAAYVFTASDPRWSSAQFVYKAHGDTPPTGDSDRFGYSIDSDAENFYVGAFQENSFKGVQSGAVYVLRKPIVQQLGPFCIGEATALTIHATPIGGTWSGPGIIDAKNGVFDQNSLPPGNHEVLYFADDCSFLEHFFIQTLPQLNATVTTPLNFILCPNIKSAISIQPVSGATYVWYSEPIGASDFSIVPNESGPTLMVSLPGLYYCKVSNGSCTTNSINIQAGFDQPAPTIGPQLILCHGTQNLSLLASPAGGTWSGNHVSGNSFSAVNLANGKYPVVYTVLSNSGCQYVLRDSVQIKAIPAVALVQSGDYCKTGKFVLSATPSDPSWTYTWSYGSTSTNYNVIDTAVHSKETFSANGFYKTFITNGVCTGETDPLPVTIDASIEISVTPADSVINICNDGSVVLNAQGPDGTVFTWQKSNSRSGILSDAGEGTSIELSEKGFINVKGVLGFCNAETPRQRVNILPADSLNVANVFSPNGDEFNNTFISQGNVNTIFALIVNRWGEEVYRSDTLDWSGQGQPPGVYFWTVVYRDCKQEEKRAKGWVQLIR